MVFQAIGLPYVLTVLSILKPPLQNWMNAITFTLFGLGDLRSPMDGFVWF